MEFEMELGIIALLGCFLAGALVLIYKQSHLKADKFEEALSRYELKQKADYRENFLEFEQKLQKNQFELQNSFQDRIGKSFEHLNQKVSDNLNLSFEKSHETIQSVVERLTRIDEAQKKIELLSKNVVSLQDLLADKKSRGIFGEVQLSHIVSSIFGDSPKYYKEQFTLSNKSIVDCILFLPEPMGKLAIDSKFPLENYRRMLEQRKKQVYKNEFASGFKRDLKKHIDDIATKYIITGETSEQAMMFLPAESIFSEIHGHHHDIVDYAFKKRVWLTSPTTLMATLSTVQVVLRNQEQSKYAHIIQDELIRLGNDFRLFKQRWTKLSKHADMLTKDLKDVSVSSDKLIKRFEKIVDVKFNNESEIKASSSYEKEIHI